MRKATLVILAINNIVLAWAIIWLNSGQVNLVSRVSRLLDVMTRALNQIYQNDYIIQQIVAFLSR